MIFVSSACSAKKRIIDAISELVSAGFDNIELSGGTFHYPEIKQDLLQIQKDYNLKFLIHNYFPPPKQDFVANLASPDEFIARKSIDLGKQAIDLSRTFGADRVSFHAGFLVDVPPNQLGKEFLKTTTTDFETAHSCLYNNCGELLDYADGSIKIYLENNVCSRVNASAFGGCPFLLLDHRDFCRIQKNLQVNLLLDIAHLQVSCHTRGIDFAEELKEMFSFSDYIHLSENDGYSDSNSPFHTHGSILDFIDLPQLTSKVVTLEIYAAMETIKISYERLHNAMMKPPAGLYE